MNVTRAIESGSKVVALRQIKMARPVEIGERGTVTALYGSPLMFNVRFDGRTRDVACAPDEIAAVGANDETIVATTGEELRTALLDDLSNRLNAALRSRELSNLFQDGRIAMLRELLVHWIEVRIDADRTRWALPSTNSPLGDNNSGGSDFKGVRYDEDGAKTAPGAWRKPGEGDIDGSG
jgi:hypothetical protein